MSPPDRIAELLPTSMLSRLTRPAGEVFDAWCKGAKLTSDEEMAIGWVKGHERFADALKRRVADANPPPPPPAPDPALEAGVAAAQLEARVAAEVARRTPINAGALPPAEWLAWKRKNGL